MITSPYFPIAVFVFALIFLLLFGPWRDSIFPPRKWEVELAKRKMELLIQEHSEAAGGRIKSASEQLTDLTRSVMPVLISIAVLSSALYIILSESYSEASQKWAFGSAGMIVGFWLRRK